MKLVASITLLAAISLMNSACVSRTVTSEKGFSDDVTKKKLIWIWEKEFRNPQY